MEQKIERWGRWVLWTFPLLAWIFRRWAIGRLVLHASRPGAVRRLAAALPSPDPVVAAKANAALRGLTSPEAVDALCGQWAKGRDAALGAIVSECRYMARSPVEVRVLSGLCSGRVEELRKEGASAVPSLVAALKEGDAGLGRAADAVLRRLTSPEAVDALCGQWAKGRDAALGAIVSECRYMARSPVEVRVLSGLCAGRVEELRKEGALAVPSLVAALKEGDAGLGRAADAILRGLTSPEAVDALCEVAIAEPQGPVARLCVERRYVPRNDDRAALFLLVTRQVDAFFEIEGHWDSLRREYDTAGPDLQGRVMEVVRSGDRRLLEFFGGRKKLRECSDDEIRLAVDSAARHGDWARVWRAALDLPLRHSASILDRLRTSGWLPPDARDQALLRELLAAGVGGLAEEAARREPAPPSSVFERWLQEGASSAEWKAQAPEALVQRLAKAPPPQGVAIVAALGARGGASKAVVRAVAESPHWLVRLAGHVTGLIPWYGRDRVEDPVHWVRVVGDARGVVDFWPVDGRPDDLERMQALPAEAWSGRLGAARRALQAVLAHRMDMGVWEEVVVEAGEFAGEFAPADEPEFA